MQTAVHYQQSNGDSHREPDKQRETLGFGLPLLGEAGFHCRGRASPSKCGSGHQPGEAGSQDIWVPAPEPSLICYKNLSGNSALLILQTWMARPINEILLCPS